VKDYEIFWPKTPGWFCSILCWLANNWNPFYVRKSNLFSVSVISIYCSVVTISHIFSFAKRPGKCSIFRLLKKDTRLWKIGILHLSIAISPDVNQCTVDQSNPCQNGGTCVLNQQSCICQCPSNWAGPMCNQGKLFCNLEKVSFGDVLS